MYQRQSLFDVDGENKLLPYDDLIAMDLLFPFCIHKQASVSIYSFQSDPCFISDLWAGNAAHFETGFGDFYIETEQDAAFGHVLVVMFMYE